MLCIDFLLQCQKLILRLPLAFLLRHSLLRLSLYLSSDGLNACALLYLKKAVQTPSSLPPSLPLSLPPFPVHLAYKRRTCHESNICPQLRFLILLLHPSSLPITHTPCLSLPLTLTSALPPSLPPSPSPSLSPPCFPTLHRKGLWVRSSDGNGQRKGRALAALPRSHPSRRGSREGGKDKRREGSVVWCACHTNFRKRAKLRRGGRTEGRKEGGREGGREGGSTHTWRTKARSTDTICVKDLTIPKMY